MLLASLSLFLWVPMFVEVRDIEGKKMSAKRAIPQGGKEKDKNEENENDEQIQKAERIEIYRNKTVKDKKLKNQTP